MLNSIEKSREVEINTKLTALTDLVPYLFDRSHSWYAASHKIFVLAQGAYTPSAIRHDRRTIAMYAESRWFLFHTALRRSPQPRGSQACC